MIPISNLVLEVYDGSTIASTEIYGTDKKTYVNIGSGNIFCLAWGLDVPPSDELDHFEVVIKRYDPTLNVYYDILTKNVGLAYKFYVNSELLPAAPLQYVLSIYVVAYGKQGSAVTSNIVNPYICKGSGTYVKAEYEGYKQPIMKRALAFAKVAETTATTAEHGTSTSNTYTDLADRDGYALLDTEGNELLALTTKLLNSINGWEVMQEGYTKGADGEWHTNDIKYEMLIAGGESNFYGEPIEVIVGKDANNNNIYEPLYVL